jgi:hypothetical protein
MWVVALFNINIALKGYGVKGYEGVAGAAKLQLKAASLGEPLGELGMLCFCL